MTDPATTRVITDHVREEADKWRVLSDDMGAINKNPIGNNGLELGSHSFFLGPTELVPQEMHFRAYSGFYDDVKRLVAAAVTEWHQLGGALDRQADEFDRTDQTVKADLDKIYREPVP